MTYTKGTFNYRSRHKASKKESAKSLLGVLFNTDENKDHKITTNELEAEARRIFASLPPQKKPSVPSYKELMRTYKMTDPTLRKDIVRLAGLYAGTATITEGKEKDGREFYSFKGTFTPKNSPQALPMLFKDLDKDGNKRISAREVKLGKQKIYPHYVHRKKIIRKKGKKTKK